MYGGNEDHYRSVGESALKIAQACQLLANNGPPSAVLDFACATGRVTRWLRAAYPAASLHVADINPDWMAWSRDTFGATGWMSQANLEDVTAPAQYDLIWCGSLATHISETETLTLVSKFHQWLKPSGVAIVSTHGRNFVRNMVAGTHKYFEHKASDTSLLAEFAIKGYGYVAHPGQSHGLSVNTLEWLIRAARGVGARVIAVSEYAWDDHQDVLAFQKRPEIA